MKTTCFLKKATGPLYISRTQQFSTAFFGHYTDHDMPFSIINVVSNVSQVKKLYPRKKVIGAME